MNSTNATNYPLTYWFDHFGFPYILDLINFYTITPLSLISLCLNIITYHILVKVPFLNSEFYSYMKLYVLNATFLSLLLMTTFIVSTHNIFEFTNSYGAEFYTLYLYGFFQSILLIFGSGLEFLLLIERSLYFSPTSFKNIKIIFKSNKCLFVFLIMTFLISGIFIFAVQPDYLDVQLDDKAWHRIWYHGVTSFSLTLAGNALFVFAYFIRDVLPLFLKIALNVFIVYLIKDYTRKLQMEKLAFAQKIQVCLHNSQSQSSLNAKNKTHHNLLSKVEVNQTHTAIIMSLFSLLEHSFYVFGHVLYFFHFYELYIFFFYAAFFSMVLKLIGNIFILYLFNSLFRNEVKKYLKFL